MTHSVENRFLAIIASAVLVLVVPLFALFLSLSSERSSKELEDHIEFLLSANAQALGKPLWDFDVESVSRITATMVTSDAISKVYVRDTAGGINVSLPPLPSWPKSGVQSKSAPIVYDTVDGPKNVGTITIYYNRHDAFSSLRQAEGTFIAIFIVAVMIVIGAAIIGNRIMIVKPLLKLTAAIEATRRLGSRHHVDWQSNDEMGRLAKSFNAMQIQLEDEERELKLAHGRATDIYNRTPAMLFSIDEDDRITGVSDYWLLATGYERYEVLGTRFSDRVEPGARAHYHARKRERRNGNSVWECTTKFVCADRHIMDILILETGKAEGDAENSLSLSVMTDVTALKQSEARNHRQAITDHLTGLMNRQGFESALDGRIADADAAGHELACLFIDLDRFKWINDNLGHQAGDTVLRMLVCMIQPLLPKGAVAARLGGDEFAILVLSPDAEREAMDLCRRICTIFDEPFVVQGTAARLSASIGVALYPSHARNAAELLQKSDIAMYTKKRDGKNGSQLYDPLFQDSTRQRAETERSIEMGLANDCFEAYLQPIVDLSDGFVVGYESLLRLNDPHKGLLPPADIIQIAEETGTIVQIGNRILEKALDNLVRLSKATGNDDTYLAINYSPRQFEQGLPMRLAALTSRYGIRPERIVIEITEAMLLHDNPLVRTILDDFKRLGCRIALDDFGTGYSSLSYLNRFPVDIVKIDQSFIRSLTEGDVEKRHKSRMLAEGITALSHKMGCAVIAEGVETEAQRNFVREFGVDYGQGYLFARPSNIEDMLENLKLDRPRTASVA